MEQNKLTRKELNESPTESPEEALDNFINMLEERRKRCESEENYLEAEVALKRIQELKAQQAILLEEKKKKQQLDDELAAEEAFQNELDGVNGEFEDKMNEVDAYYLQQQDELTQKHKDELESLHAQLEQTIPKKAKPSPALLNTIKIQQSLAKQRKYVEAHEAQQRALALQEKEQEQWSEKRAAKIAAQEAVLIQRQNKENDALDARVQKVKEELTHQKEMMVKTVLLKYQNLKRQIKLRETKKNTTLTTSRELSKTSRSFNSLNKSFGSGRVKRSLMRPLWK